MESEWRRRSDHHVGVINQIIPSTPLPASSLVTESFAVWPDIYYALVHYNELANFSIKKENVFNWLRQTGGAKIRF